MKDSRDMVPFHPVIQKILSDLEPKPGGAVLSDKNGRKWAAALSVHRDKQALAIQLIALAKSFSDEGCRFTTRDLVVLAAITIGAANAAAALANAGIDPSLAKKLVEKANPKPASPVRGLALPTGGGAKPRRKR